jgi:hypothetical protein
LTAKRRIAPPDLSDVAPLIIVSHAVLVGLTPLIPIPVVDDLVKAYFYRRLVQALASAYGLSLRPDEVALLAEERGRGCLSGCLFGLVEYLLKRLVRKIIFVLEWRRAIDLVTHTYYIGHLLDYAFRQGWYTPGDPARAGRLRAAIEQARADANTGIVKRIVQAGFNQSRALVLSAVQQVSASVHDIAVRRSRLWLRRKLAVRLRQRAPRLARWLYQRLRPSAADQAQATQTEAAVDQKMTDILPRLQTFLSGLITYLQTNLAAVPDEHFGSMQRRLEQALAAASD